MTDGPLLRDGELVLRGFRDDDVEGRQALGVDPDVVRAFGGTPDSPTLRAMTREEAQAWLDERRQDDGRVAWAVEVAGRFVGHVQLSRIVETSRKATYAVGILDRSLWSQGYGRRVATLVLGHAFDTMGLHRVSLKVFAYHERAIRSYEAAGFVREGLEREIHLVDGVWQDDVVMGILEHEWRARPAGSA